jgi:hypothetical protein
VSPQSGRLADFQKTRNSSDPLPPAKADRFAWAAAELLANGKSADASDMALQGIALIGRVDFTSSCNRYATSVFRVPPKAAREFLEGVSRSD